MRVLALLLLLLFPVGMVAGCGGDDSDSGGGLEGKEFVDEKGHDAVTVDAIDNSFRPQYIEVSAGTTVTFDNRGRNTHNVVPAKEDAFQTVAATDFAPGGTAEVVFDKAGDYAYYCSLHGTATQGMTGGVRVVD